MTYEKISDGSQYQPGIYLIQSVCGKVYIGSAVKLRQRFMAHRGRLQKNMHDNCKLQNYFNKYGEESLKFIVIEYCDKENLIKREQYFIDLYNPSFNIARTAGATYGLKPWLNRKHTQETKDKIKATNLATFAKRPKEVKPLTLKLTREENTKRIIDLNKTPEAKLNLSKKQKGNINWLGKKHKPETIAARMGAGNGRARKVLCINIDKTFNTCIEAAVFFGVSKAAISNSITRKLKIKSLYTLQYAS